VRDTKPSEEAAEYLELEAVKPIDNGSAATDAQAAPQADSGLNVDMTSPIADMPPSFEYPFGQD